MRSPSVSVIVACYNGERFVREAIESILSQDYENFEIVVCDDGSTDRTQLILQDYEDRVRVVRQQNQGVAVARNRAIQASTGEILAFLDQDDLWMPQHLSHQVPFLLKNPAVGIVYADSWVIDEEGHRHGRRSSFLHFAEGEVFSSLLLGNFIPLETMLVRRSVLDEVGLFNSVFHYLEDHELCLRVARRYTLALDPEPLACYRIHGNNLSHHKKAILEENITILQQLLDQDAELTPDHVDSIQNEITRLQGELAWHLLRQDDLSGSRRLWCECGPGRQSWQVHGGYWALRLMGRRGRAWFLRHLPPRTLYGLSPTIQTPSPH